MAYNGYITPSTTITLYSNCPLPSNYEHTFYFSSLSAQTSYFNGLNKTLYANNTYNVISAGVIRIGDTINNVFNKSYMSFINANSNFENKTFYCFITDVVYINNNCTEIHYVIDVMQTYMFEYATLSGGVLALHKKQFVDKTHIPLADDVITNAVMLNDEGLDTGVENKVHIEIKDMPNFGRGLTALIFMTGHLNHASNLDSDTSIPNDLTPKEIDTSIWFPNQKVIVVKTPDNHVYNYSHESRTSNLTIAEMDRYMLNPLTVYAVDIYDNDGHLDTNGVDPGITGSDHGYQSLVRYLEIVNALGKSESIVKVMLVPHYIMSKYPTSSTSNFLTVNIGEGVTALYGDTITIGSSVDGYTPKNKKLMCYPFNYYVLDNNEGEQKTYKPQFFNNGSLTFRGISCIAEGGVIIYPIDYYTSTSNDINNGLQKTIARQMPYVISSYSDWLANSTISRNIAINSHAVSSQLGIISGVLTGGDNLTSKARHTDEYANWGLRRAFAADEGKPFNEPAPKKMYKYSIGGKAGFIGNAVETAGNAIGNTYSFISSLAAQNAEHKEVPNSVVGTFDGYMNLCASRYSFTLYNMTVTKHIAQRIDHYFSAYGYKINDWREVKLKVRDNWTFVKTAGCAIEPDHIPTMFEEQINSIFDNGITFWSNTSGFMNYGDWTNN